MRLSFLGGTGTVTGSKYLLEHAGRRLLIDCGLFQGIKQLRLRNWDALSVAASSIDAVVLSHAHLDHSGWLPRLRRDGFEGFVWCTAATRDLCELLLPDSGRLLEEEADFANRHGFSKHRPALPLYDEEAARATLRMFRTIPFDVPFEPVPGMAVSLRPAGHLLGAASIRVAWPHRAIVFSGDLGRQDDLLMWPPNPPHAADWLVVESTYGDRARKIVDPLAALGEAINRVASRGGVIVVPAFAVGRAQALLHAVHELKLHHRIADLPVYLDSPMAAGATRIYQAHRAGHRLTTAQTAALCFSATIVESIAASRRLNGLQRPAVIISASGMASGGRVLHHLKAYAPSALNGIILTGFQAAGTRGAALAAGASTVKIHGEHVPVRAEVVMVDSLSAHADRDELLAWVGASPVAPRRVFVTHGEPVASDALRQAIEERCGWPCVVPEFRDTVELE
jgi:metallo-beta-lactamase family protein